MDREINEDDDKNDSLYLPEDEFVKETKKEKATGFRDIFQSTSSI